MTSAKVIKRTKKARDIRTAKQGRASDAIGELEAGCEIYILTFGQFSLIDALYSILQQTGPADVDIATWTAANAHLDEAASLLERAQIASMRWVVDRSFLTRQPKYCAKMRDIFGDACIRTCRSHAKFITVRNNQWNLAIRTSMNLNENPRMENIEISDDPILCGHLVGVVDGIFDEHAESDMTAGIPDLGELENVAVQGQLN